MRLKLIGLLLIPFSFSMAQDWKDFPVPADPGSGYQWVLQEEVSDDFNYDGPAGNLGQMFFSKWNDFYHNAWTGPGGTVWSREKILVKDGQLQIPASRLGSDKISTGCVTSKVRVQYPVYIETRAKISNSVLSSGAWLLSPDDTQEIDFLEAYGSSFSDNTQESQSWFAERIHVSHHVFIRQPFQDYQPTDAGSWYRDGTLWREEFHNYGVYWKDPWNLEYYIDGKLVRKVSGRNIIDPKNFTSGTGLSKEMDIIFSVEDQDWRRNRGITPTDKELEDKESHTFKIDWIRAYKLEPMVLHTPQNRENEDVKVYPNPSSNGSFSYEFLKEPSEIKLINVNGKIEKYFQSNDLKGEFVINNSVGQVYQLVVGFKNGEKSIKTIINY